MYDVILQNIIQLNFIPIIVIIFLLSFLKINKHYEIKEYKDFKSLVILIILLIIDDNLDYYAFDNGIEGILHIITAVIGYNIRIYLLLALTKIVLKRVDFKFKKYLYIPALINTGVTCLAFFTHLVFWYEGTVVKRGPLAYTPHIIMLLYCLILFIYAFYTIIRLGKNDEATIIILSVMAGVGGMLVELIFSLRGILIGVIAMIIVFYYLYIQIEHFRYDILTGVRNRDTLYADIKKYKIYDVISVDLNNLKEINDTNGHIEGDRALKTLAMTTQQCLPSWCRLYRYGGDEFVILCLKNNEFLLNAILDKIERHMRKTDFIWSMGKAHWEENDTFTEVYAKADKEMYERKQNIKSNPNYLDAILSEESIEIK